MRCDAAYSGLSLQMFKRLFLSVIRLDTNGGNRIFCNLRTFYHTTRSYITENVNHWWTQSNNAYPVCAKPIQISSYVRVLLSP